jgi:hypothetical protein
MLQAVPAGEVTDGDSVLSRLVASGLTKEEAGALFSAACSSGALVGGDRSSASFTHPMAALARVAPHPGQIPALERALAGIERDFEALSASELRASTRAARDRLIEVSGEDHLPECPFRFDQAADFAVTFGPELAARFERMEARFLEAHRTSPGHALRKAAAARFSAALGSSAELFDLPRVLGQVALGARARSWRDIEGFDPAVRAAVARWDAILAGSGQAAVPPADGSAAISADTEASPVFTLMLWLFEDARALIHGLFDELAPLVARYGSVVDDDRLVTWLSQAVRSVEPPIEELALPMEGNLNALARPSVVERAHELWTASGLLGLEGARLVPGPNGEAPLVEHDGRRFRLASFSSAHLADPIAVALLRSSGRDPPVANFQVALIPYPSELDEPHLTPRLQLDDSTAVLPRRVILEGDAMRGLLERHGPNQDRAFRTLCRSLALPELMFARRGLGPPLLLATTSPLAIEAILEGARPDERLTLTELWANPWLEGPDGHHHVELGVPFLR